VYRLDSDISQGFASITSKHQSGQLQYQHCHTRNSFEDKLLQFLAKHSYHGLLVLDNSGKVVLLHSICCKTGTNSIYTLLDKSLNSLASSTLITDSTCSITWYHLDDLKSRLQSFVSDVGSYLDDIKKIKTQFPEVSTDDFKDLANYTSFNFSDLCVREIPKFTDGSVLGSQSTATAAHEDEQYYRNFFLVPPLFMSAIVANCGLGSLSEQISIYLFASPEYCQDLRRCLKKPSRSFIELKQNMHWLIS
jgi:hypothetical protein